MRTDHRRARLTILALLAISTTSACTHQMEVKNLHEFSKASSAQRQLTLALEDRSTTPAERAYFDYVREALAVHPAVRSVKVLPNVPPDFAPDYVVAVHPRADYRGSWLNYFITFPGFLLFTHAWNGFVYRADLVTEIALSRPGAAPATASPIATDYDMRHCDFGRGFWTSSGWYTPGYGALNALIGLWMVRYDDDATPEFQSEVRSAYGSYIANSIVELTDTSTGQGVASLAPSGPCG